MKNACKVTAEIFEGEKLLEAQIVKVNEEVERILKMDYELFTRAVYSEQNAIDMFLNLPKGQRMKKIDEMLYIDKFEIARKNANSFLNKLENEIEEKEKLISSFDIEKDNESIERIKLEIKELEFKSNEMLINKNKIKNELDDSKARLEFLESKKEEFQKIMNEMKTFERLKANIEEDLKSEAMIDEIETRNEFQKIKNEKDELEILVKKENENLNSIKNAFHESSAKLSMIESKLKEAENKILIKKSLENEIKNFENIKSEYENLEKKFENIRNSFNEIIIRLSNLDNSLKNLKCSKERCSVCDSELTEEKRNHLIKIREEEEKALKNERNMLLIRYKEVEAEKNRLKELLSRLEISKNKYLELMNIENENSELMKDKEAYKKLIKKSETEMNSKEIMIESLKNKISDLQKKENQLLMKIERMEEVKRKQEKLIKIKEELAKLNSDAKSYSKYDFSEIEKLKKEYENKIKEYAEINSELNYISKIISEKSNILAELTSRTNKIKSIENEIEKDKRIMKALKIISSGLSMTQEELRKEFIAAVNQSMMSLWPDLYPYKDFYSIRLWVEDGDYVLQLQDETGWVPVDGVASGGERIIACLALRIAFSLALAPQLRWLVLDEPTHNLDSRTIEEFSNVLRERISEFVEQVFIITHDKNLESAVTGYLYRIERENEKMGSSKVIKINAV